jgi:hypothetical protein
MLAFYVFTVGLVAAVLFQAVNRLEPNRRLATALKFLIIVVGVAAQSYDTCCRRDRIEVLHKKKAPTWCSAGAKVVVSHQRVEFSAPALQL